jgi:hypothetical protein
VRWCALVTLVAAGCLVDNPAWLGLSEGGGSGGSDTGDEPLPAGCDPLAEPDDAIEAGPDTIDDVLASAAPGATIVMQEGFYDRAGRPPLVIAADGVTLRGAGEVVLDGGFMADPIVQISASDVMLADLELRNSEGNLVALAPDGADILRPRLYRLELGNSVHYQVSAERPGPPFVDDGELACTRSTITDEFRVTQDPCLLGSIRVNAGRDWHVHDNRFTGHWCLPGTPPDGSTANPTVQLTSGSRDGLVERNVMVDVQRGIAYGSDGAGVEERAYADNPCTAGVFWGHIGGTIRNNAIWIGEAATTDGADSLITVWHGCDVDILHNTVVNLVSVYSSIEFRYMDTTVNVANNLVTDRLYPREGGVGQVLGNLEYADLALIVDPLTPDLHLRDTATDAIDRGLPLTTMPVVDDIDGDTRDALPDIGADERVATQ